MKGFVDEPWWTVAVAIVAIGSFIIIIFFMIYSTLRTSDVAFIGGHNNAFRQSMKFVDVVEDPFIIGSVVSDLRQDNRGVYEHATQIMETFFAIPGLGNFTIEAIQSQDFAIVRSMVYLGSILYIAGLLLTDISYTLVDPRVRLE